jgi:hypothetical protein
MIQLILSLSQIYGICSLIALILGIWIAVKKRGNISPEQSDATPLTLKEKWLVFVLCFFSPIILGAVFYYSWKQRLPQQAKTANWLSIVAFIIVLPISIWFVFIFIPNNINSVFPGVISSPSSHSVVFASDFPTITITASDTAPSSWKSLPPDSGISFRYPSQMGGGPFGGFLYSCQQSNGTITTDAESAPSFGDSNVCDGTESFIQVSTANGPLEENSLAANYYILPNKIEKVSIQHNGNSNIFYIGSDNEGTANPNVWVVDTQVGNQLVQIAFGGNGFFFNQASSSIAMVISQAELNNILPILSSIVQVNQTSTVQ